MAYEATIVHNGKPLLTRKSSDSNKLLGWVLSHLEREHYQYAMGIIRNKLNVHESPRMYTAHNPHFD